MSVDITLHCSSCGADFERHTLEENLELMSNCPNCLSDLKSKGKWTGVAHNIMNKLVELHGIKTVKYTLEKLMFERT